MPSACRCRPGLPAYFSRPPTARCSNCCGGMRARMGRSPRPMWRRASAWRRRKSSRCSAALHADGKLLEGEFRPEGVHREWCDPDVLQQVRRKTLARLRREVVPAEQHTFVAAADPLAGSRGTAPRPRRAARYDRNPARRRAAGFRPGARDPAGAGARLPSQRSGRADGLRRRRVGRPRTARGPRRPHGAVPGRCAAATAAAAPPPELSERAQRIARRAAARWAHRSSRPSIRRAGGGFPGDTQDALWELVWAGIVTNDTLHPLRNLLYVQGRGARRGASCAMVRPVRPNSCAASARARAAATPPRAAGRWSRSASAVPVPATEWSANVAAATAGAQRHRDARDGASRRTFRAAIR